MTDETQFPPWFDSWRRDDIPYPPDDVMYLGDVEMMGLLKAHGFQVSYSEMREKAGIYWDGGPGENKWYECLSYYERLNHYDNDSPAA